ncbi:MAG: aromatic amino acid lyase, partial [Chloroflexota bacterium]|nr:aromatic amino acid lyase [Chloroflexota bacterium]
MKPIVIDGQSLTIEEITSVARHGATVALAESAKEAINESRKWVQQIVDRGEPVYGINTGFGIFAERRIPAQDSA